MTNKFDIDKIMNLAFLLTLFFIPIEMAMTIRIGSMSPYKLTMLVLLAGMVYSLSQGRLMTYVQSFIDTFLKFKWAIISIFLYFVFDIVSLAWTKDIIFSLKKYATIGPMVILAIYATYYLYGPEVSPEKRSQRLRKLALCFGLIALFLSLLTWIMYFIYKRTYYIMTLSLQNDYNQYVLPLIIGYVCGVYYINTMKPSWQRYVLFAAYSAILMPNFYLSGSRRIMVIYVIIFAILSLYFLITNLSYSKSILSLLISLGVIGGIFLSHKIIIDGYQFYSRYVYETMAEDAKRKGIKPPSAQMDKSDGIIHDFRLEQDASFKEDTLESGQAMGRRGILWSIAFNEIKSFNIKELLIGRGGSYQRDIYRTEEARALLYDRDRVGAEQDFHPHSMVLVDMLNGGLIKTSLTLSLVLAMVYYALLNFLRKNYHEFILIGGYGAILLLSQIIDSIYGLLQNRMTWFFIFIVLASVGDLKKRNFKKIN